MPITWEKRETGVKLRFTVKVTHQGVDLDITPERVSLDSRQSYGEVEQPFFSSQRLNSSVRVQWGSPFLLGTLNRFCGGTNSNPAPSPDRVWLSFVTVSQK